MSQQVISKPVVRAAGGKSPGAWIALGLVALTALALIIWFVVRAGGGGEPRLNDSTEALSRFVMSGAFDELPFEKQKQFYKVLDDRDKQIDQAFRERRLTEAQYRAALEAAWLGKHLNRVERYFALSPGQARADYISGLLAKKNKKSAREERDGIGVDESAAELRVERWPQAVRDQWNQFHAAYKKEKKAREPPSTRPQ